MFAKRYSSFFAPVLLYQLALNLVLQSDLLVMKAVLSRDASLTPESINALAGIYKAVQNFAFLPYQLLLAVTFVVFPVVSKATLEGDAEATRTFVRNTLRFSAIALGAMLSVLAGLPRGVLRLAYRPPFDQGAAALRVLSLAEGCFALSVIGTTILLAAGHTGAATALVSLMLAGVYAGDLVGLSVAPRGVSSLLGVATGTAAGCALGVIAVGVYLHRRFGGFLAASTAVRVGASCAVAAGLIAQVPWQGKLATLVLSGVAVGLYAVALVASGELKREEVSRVVGLLTGRR